MRKICLMLMLAFFVGFSASAQIQRKFFEFRFSSTSKNEVVQYFKKHGKKMELSDRNVEVYNVRFGGEQWPSVIFNFYKDRLSGVSFCNSATFTSKASLDKTFENLKNKLNRKYSQYYDNTSDNEIIRYSDGTTLITLANKFMEGDDVLVLMYFDYYMSMGQLKEGIDEL